MKELGQALLGWIPLLLILGVYWWVVRRSVAKQGSMIEIGKENTEAVRENTAALRTLIAKLDERNLK